MGRSWRRKENRTAFRDFYLWQNKLGVDNFFFFSNKIYSPVCKKKKSLIWIFHSLGLTSAFAVCMMSCSSFLPLYLWRGTYIIYTHLTASFLASLLPWRYLSHSNLTPLWENFLIHSSSFLSLSLNNNQSWLKTSKQLKEHFFLMLFRLLILFWAHLIGCMWKSVTLN